MNTLREYIVVVVRRGCKTVAIKHQGVSYHTLANVTGLGHVFTSRGTMANPRCSGALAARSCLLAQSHV